MAGGRQWHHQMENSSMAKNGVNGAGSESNINESGSNGMAAAAAASRINNVYQ